MAAVHDFVGIICVAAPLRALDVYVEKRLVAVWRASRTSALISAYTTGHAYFHLQLARGTEGAAAAGEPPDGAGGGAAGALELAALQQPPQPQQAQQGPQQRAPAKQAAAGDDGAAAAAAPDAAACVAGFSGTAAGVDNPDQRIVADVANFTQTSTGLAVLLLKKSLNCAAFAGVLWSISPHLVAFLLAYALLGTVGTAAVFGRPLTRLQQRILRLEADLRFGLVRLRENAEAIAFYGGDAREARALAAHLAALLAALLQRIRWLGLYELWVTAYTYATASYAFSVLEGALGLILAKLDEFSALAAETSRLSGLLDALAAADVDAGGNGAVRGFPPAGGATHGGGLGALAGLAGRVRGGRRPKPPEKSEGGGADGQGGDDGDDGEATRLLVASDGDDARRPSGEGGRPGAAPRRRRGSGGWPPDAPDASGGGRGLSRVLRLMDGSSPGLVVEGLSAWVPGRHHAPTPVCRGLSFTLAPGESLLVVGPSGCGKSSLLRVLAGLWTSGSGVVRGPPASELFFLPQRPFMPLGSLRSQLTFPDWRDGAARRQQPAAALRPSGSSTAIDMAGGDGGAERDAALEALVGSVRLSHLLTRHAGGLDAEVDWASVLSLGEQQRVAVVRLLHHRPSLAVLDEATAALDPASEAAVYRLVAAACPSYVSVGHRPQLLDWHSHVLAFAGTPGRWALWTADEWRARVAAGLEAA
ncbi:Abcd2 [Scenedesmus sp. PABB004]|nr:Abcd2 [Scenedesmus sp. PABB004]